MKATLLRNIVAFGILLGGLTNHTLIDAQAAEGPDRKPVAGHRPFRGKIDTLDKTARTIKVGARTFHVMDTTKIVKAGKPSTFDDATVGDQVGGAYRNADGGKFELVSLRLGPKPEKDEPAGSGKTEGKGKQGGKEKEAE